MQNQSHIPVEKLPDWINAVGILLSNLPHVYWIGLHNRIEQVGQPRLRRRTGQSWQVNPGSVDQDRAGRSTQGQEENRIEQVGQPRVRRRTGQSWQVNLGSGGEQDRAGRSTQVQEENRIELVGQTRVKRRTGQSRQINPGSGREQDRAGRSTQGQEENRIELVGQPRVKRKTRQSRYVNPKISRELNLHSVCNLYDRGFGISKAHIFLRNKCFETYKHTQYSWWEKYYRKKVYTLDNSFITYWVYQQPGIFH